MLEWGADVIKVELPGFGDQSRWLPISREDRRSAFFTALQPRQTQRDRRPPRATGSRSLPAHGRAPPMWSSPTSSPARWTTGAWATPTRHAQRADRLCDGLVFRYRKDPTRTREGADLSAQAAGGLISTTGGNGSDPSPIGATIADHVSGQNLLAGVLAALYARERTGRGQLVETSLLGGQIWAQAGEYTRYLMSGQPSGPSGRSHPMIPGIYGRLPHVRRVDRHRRRRRRRS